jgi:glycosyltransferase involved in cell wall biosynthesis
MKPNITVAIPFYNSIDYIEDAIRIPLFDNRVSEIVICDDASSDEQYQQLTNKINSLLNGEEISYDVNYNLIKEKNASSRPSIFYMTSQNVSEESKKIVIYRNEKNLGGFANKYETVKKSTNDWVYLLDSDNFLIDCSIPSLYNIEEWNKKICYCPSTLIMERKDSWRAWDDWNHRKLGFEPIDLQRIKLLFQLDNSFHSEHGCGLGVNGFLNTGNFFVNRNFYLNALDEAIENNIEPYAADVIAFSYYWLTVGNMFKIVPDLYYYHRLREDSFWNRTGGQSGFEAQNYERMIKNANA